MDLRHATVGVLPVVGGLPQWLLWGVLFGVLVSAAIACVFYAGTRLFPTEHREGTTGRGQRTRDGRSRRHLEIRQYLEAIGEQFLEDHTVEGREVAFYLPERDVAITFDARAFYHIDRSATHAVLVEHELPGVHIGFRLPFETPDPASRGGGDAGRGWNGDARRAAGRGWASHAGGGDGHSWDGDPVSGAHAVLGVPATATPSDIEAAYREKIKEVHPDHGGDTTEFRRVRDAYATATRDGP